MREFRVLVIASDEGDPPMSSEVNFTVTINDLNDNYPHFTYATYGPYSLSEGTTPPYSLVTVSATDSDTGPNSDLTYLLENGGGRFSINPQNGDITLVSSLDREVTDFYSLIVKAYDHGETRLTSTISLNVSVSDINDNSPQFTMNTVSSEVPENTTSNSLIATLTATDADIGSNGTITFDIISGDTNNVFNVTVLSIGNVYTGEIRLRTGLDYETQATYNLIVRASDDGPTPRTSTANVYITVTNVNDNSPTFKPSPNYMFLISEVAQPGSSVGTVQATDSDLGEFGVISSYSFAPGTPSYVTGNFTISNSTGVISLSSSSSLDYETQQLYSFNVVATDAGGVSSTGSVVVTVIDYNDNQPIFDQSFYSGNISENLQTGSSVLQVSLKQIFCYFIILT